MTVHGVAGYAAGCRCEPCFSAQREREAQLAADEKHRWSSTTQRAHQARMQRAPLRQQHQQTTPRQHITATEQARQLYQQAIARQDYRWLLEAERRTLNSVRTRTSHLIRRISDTPHDCTELLWRQTQQMRALAEHHHRQLTDHLDLDSLPATDNSPAASIPTPE